MKFSPPGCLQFEGRMRKGPSQPGDLLSLFQVTVVLLFFGEKVTLQNPESGLDNSWCVLSTCCAHAHLLIPQHLFGVFRGEREYHICRQKVTTVVCVFGGEGVARG